MSPEFASLVNRVFDNVLDLTDRIDAHTQPDLNIEKNIIRQDLERFAATASGKSDRQSQEYELARRALIYWVDEVLTLADSTWKEMTLEFDYFNEQNRAWRFYTFGETAAQTGSSDVIETWYLCLVLGFEGDIGEAFREHLHQPLPGGATNSTQARQKWAENLARLIRKPTFADMTGEPLSGGVELLTGASWLRTIVACLFVSSVAFIVLFAIYWKVSRS